VLLILPTNEKIFVPGLPSVPIRRYQSAPSRMMNGVDVFRAWLAGQALQRGHQRRRFAANECAAAAADLDVEREAAAQNVVAQQAQRVHLIERDVGVVHGERIFVAHVNVALPAADGVRADDHAFEHEVRVAFEQRAIHERAGVAFVGVAQHVLRFARRLAAAFPLHPGREPAAAAPAQVGFLDLGDDLFGLHRTERLGQTGVAARGDVVLDVGRIERAVVAEHQPALVLIERHLMLVREFFAGRGVNVKQPVDDLAGQHRLFDDLRRVFRLHVLIEHVLRPDDEQRAAFAEAVAAGLAEFDAVVEATLGQFLFERRDDFFRAAAFAAGAAANGNHRLGRVARRHDLRPVLFEGRVVRQSFHGYLPSCFFIAATSFRIFALFMWPWYSPSTTTSGPSAQLPRQLTVSSVKLPSFAVVSGARSSSRAAVSRIIGAPRTWQAVPMHTDRQWRPLACRLNAL
jgi:hypothetical protein